MRRIQKSRLGVMAAVLVLAALIVAGCEIVADVRDVSLYPDGGGSSSSGMVMSCTTLADCPPGGLCTTAQCSGGLCGLTAVLDGTACNDGLGSCNSGSCACMPAHLCGSACVDAMTDAANCGACGQACPAGISCVAGQCACPGSQGAFCANACVDTSTDPANCGSCGHDCQGGTCMGSLCQPVTLSSGQNAPFSIAVDAKNVYWTNGGTLWKVPIAGGTATQLALGNQLWAIAVDAMSVYWTDYNGHSVGKVPIGGGATTLLASGQQLPTAIAVNATSVYWSAGVADFTVMQVATTGGTPAQVAGGPYASNGVALDATSFYWTGEGDGSITKASLAGVGAATTLASGQASPEAIAVDATGVYWINAGSSANNFTDGAIMKVALDGGATTALASGQVLAGGTVFAYFIAVDTTSVYWTVPGSVSVAYADGAVMKVAKTGGAATTVASGQVQPRGIALDTTTLYWANQQGGTVMKLAK